MSGPTSKYRLAAVYHSRWSHRFGCFEGFAFQIEENDSPIADIPSPYRMSISRFPYV